MLSNFNSISQIGNQRKAENAEAFIRLYGYIQYFYPIEKPDSFDWSKFSLYGLKKVIYSKNDQELIANLNLVFLLVAPNLEIGLKQNQPRLPKLTKKSKNGYRFWQYQGMNLHYTKNSVYKRKLVRYYSSKHDSVSSTLIFPQVPKNGEIISRSISKSLICFFPVSISENEKNVFADQKKTKKFIEQINLLFKNSNSVEDTCYRLAYISEIWNLTRHFYPFHDKTTVNWDESLSETINKCLISNNQSDFSKTKFLLVSQMNDGHTCVDGSYSGLPFSVLNIGNEYYVDNIRFPNNLRHGDKILFINSKSAKSYFTESKKYYSGSEQLKNVMINLYFGYGDRNENLEIQFLREGDTICENVKREVMGFICQSKDEKPLTSNFKICADSIYYINMANADEMMFLSKMDDLLHAKGIIFDFRSFPGPFRDNILAHLCKDTMETPYFYTPQIIYPDQEQLKFDTATWFLYPQKPYLTCKKAFLINGKAISACETQISFVKQYKLGPLIGQETAGANGNYIVMKFLDVASLTWTGLRVVDKDGHLTMVDGYKPDIEVMPTLEGFKAGRDEVLERAMEYINTGK